jgi:hypothetical protein
MTASAEPQTPDDPLRRSEFTDVRSSVWGGTATAVIAVIAI